MKLWSAMYGIIWLAFLEILLVLSVPLGYSINAAIHILIAVGLLALAFYIYRGVRSTSCPDRIKRITKVTWRLVHFPGCSWRSSHVGDRLVMGRNLLRRDRFPACWDCSSNNHSGFLHCNRIRHVGRKGIPSKVKTQEA